MTGGDFRRISGVRLWQDGRMRALRRRSPDAHDLFRYLVEYEQGVHPKIISQRLGHSSAAFTMDTYGYLDRGLQAPITAKLQQWLDENAPE